MAERVQRCRNELQHAEAAIDGEGRRLPARPMHDHDQQLREHEAQQRRQHDAERRDGQSAIDNRGKPRLGDGGSGETAHQRMTAARWNTQAPGHDVPDDGAGQRAEDDAAVHYPGAHDARAERSRHVQPEYRECDEIEKRAPHDGSLRAQHPRCHDRRDRIGSIVKSIEEVEQQRGRDQCGEYRESERGSVHVVVPGSAMRAAYTCLAVIDWMAFATSSHLSTTFSMSSYSSFRSM